VSVPALTLLVRAYCHLCEEMRAELLALVDVDQGRVALTEIDVDGDPVLAARWGDLVPVLLLGERELCHYQLDSARVAQALAEAHGLLSQ
jgi:Glutaredoxin-like domain (DUF836)